MISSRAVSGVLLGLGGLAGTLLDGVPPRPPLYRGGLQVLAADFHVHSFSADGALPPWELVLEARRRGLDAFAITNHAQVWAAKLGRWFSRRIGGPTVLVGEEITSWDYHLIAVGIEASVPWNQPATKAVEEVHRQGGVAIAAHPVAISWPAFEEALDTLDGSEVLHPLVHVSPGGRSGLSAFYERGRSRGRPFAAVGSSDYHFGAGLGAARTYVFARENRPAAILESLRAGRTVVYDEEGVAHGDPALAALLESDPLPADSRPDRTTVPSRAAGICGWLGLAGLVLLRSTRSRRGVAPSAVR